MNEPTSLEGLFERYESLPSQDAEDPKRATVELIVAAVAERLAGAGDDERYRTVRDATARLRLLSPGAAGFDEAVLEVIDATRDAFGDGALAEVVPVRPAPSPARTPTRDGVTEASEGSFPASDPPGFVAGNDGSG